MECQTEDHQLRRYDRGYYYYIINIIKTYYYENLTTL